MPKRSRVFDFIGTDLPGFALLFCGVAYGSVAHSIRLVPMPTIDAAAMVSFHSVVQLLLSWWMIGTASALTVATIALSQRRIDGV